LLLVTATVEVFAQQLAVLPLSSFYIAPLRFSTRVGYTRSTFHFFLSLSLPLSIFLIKKIFTGTLEKQAQHTAVSSVTKPIKNEIH